jgi:hypothetical protein
MRAPCTEGADLPVSIMVGCLGGVQWQRHQVVKVDLELTQQAQQRDEGYLS